MPRSKPSPPTPSIDAPDGATPDDTRLVASPPDDDAGRALAPVTPLATSDVDGEAGMLARRLDAAYRARVEYAQREGRGDPASGEHDGVDRTALFGRMMRTPPEQLTWEALELHWADEPESCAAKWEEVKALARTEFDAGVPMVEALGKDTPWERARLIATLSAFREEWRPRGGVELALLEQAALAYHWWLEWQRRAHRLAEEADRDGPRIRRNVEKGYPRSHEVARLEAVRRREGEALQHADRFQRAFLRAVRTLRDLRRYAGAIHIHNEGQVNIAEQQVNVKE